MRRLKLAFDDAQLEREFRADYGQRRLSYLRFVLAAGPGLYAAFGVLDAIVAPEVRLQLWLIRYAVVCPVVLAVLLWSYLDPRRFMRHSQPLMAGQVILSGLGIVAMTAITQPPSSHFYYAGLMLVIFLGFTVASLHFVSATLAAWTIVLAYELTATLIDHTAWKVVVSNNFFLVSSCLIGMLACYSRERLERRGFLDMRTLAGDRQQLGELNEQLREIALRDHLTDLLSRRYLEERLGELIASFRRYHTPASLLLLDLDGFKEINDRYGHPAGDRVLRLVADSLRRHVRDTDLVYRYGGDEFCIVLPNTELGTTRRVGERVLGALGSLTLPDSEEPSGVGLSAGAVAITDSATSAAELLARADVLLYRAKREGRGRIVIDGPS